MNIEVAEPVYAMYSTRKMYPVLVRSCHLKVC